MNGLQQSHRKRTLRSSLRILCISCYTLTSESFGPNVVQYINTHQKIHHQNPLLSSLPLSSLTVTPAPAPTPTRIQLPTTTLRAKSLPDSSSSLNQRNNKGKPKPLDLRKTRKQTALKAAWAAKVRERERSPASPTVTAVAMETISSTRTRQARRSTSAIATKKTKTEIEYEPSPHRVRAQRLAGRTGAGAWYQRDEMMQHDILTREEEMILGRKIVKAKDLRDQMIALIEKRKLDAMESKMNLDLNWEINSQDAADYDYDGIGSVVHLEEEYEEEGEDVDEYGYDRTSRYSGVEGVDFPSIRYDDTSHTSFKGDRRTTSTLVKDGSKLIASSFDADINLLSQEDIQTIFKIEGGRTELRSILHEGARARHTLMRSNIRLVVSIGKKWMGNNKDTGGIADRYNGSWDRPSLDEVIQEGILGLARAADKFDPDRGLRFSTYSTHWITSFVRQCFQAAATGCLKVPSQLHDIKGSYKSIIRRHIEASESFPTEEQIASEIGVTKARLRTAIRVTESLLSIDEPVYTGGNAAFKGSGAGGDLSGENNLLISDRLECSEIAPEDYVETGFLRQTLENAMATELSPYERDILRLRLGLDDGQSRTVKQVVEACGGDISVAEVRSAERRAFKKLRSPNAIHAHNLVAYLEMADIDSDSFEGRW